MSHTKTQQTPSGRGAVTFRLLSVTAPGEWFHPTGNRMQRPRLTPADRHGFFPGAHARRTSVQGRRRREGAAVFRHLIPAAASAAPVQARTAGDPIHPGVPHDLHAAMSLSTRFLPPGKTVSTAAECFAREPSCECRRTESFCRYPIFIMQQNKEQFNMKTTREATAELWQ